MIILEKLVRNQRTMKAVFGLDAKKFYELAERMDAEWFKALESRPGRKRAPGAGQPSKIAGGAQKLAFILFYLKVYPTFDVMGVFCGINAGDCCRWAHRLMPVLEELLGQRQALPKRRIGSVEEFAAAFPEAAEVMIDGMERPVQRPKKKRRSTSTTPARRRGTHARRWSSWIEGAASATSRPASAGRGTTSASATSGGSCRTSRRGCRCSPTAASRGCGIPGCACR